MELTHIKWILIILLAIFLPFLPFPVFSSMACNIEGYWLVAGIIITILMVLVCYGWLMWQPLFKANISPNIKLLTFIIYTLYAFVVCYVSMFAGAIRGMGCQA